MALDVSSGAARFQNEDKTMESIAVVARKRNGWIWAIAIFYFVVAGLSLIGLLVPLDATEMVGKIFCVNS